MRTISLVVLPVILGVGIWQYYSGVASRTDKVIVTAKDKAQRWSASQQRESNKASSPPLMMATEACREFNARIVGAMRVLYQEGHSPPFSPEPLLEIIRSGDCSEDNPSVQVLLSWISETRIQPGAKRRSSER